MSPRQRDGGHVVFRVVQSGQLDLVKGHEIALFVPGKFRDNGVILNIDRTVDVAQCGARNRFTGKKGYGNAANPLDLLADLSCHRVAIVQNRASGMAQNPLFRFDILCHVRVPVQMVRRDVRDSSRRDRCVNSHELKARQLHSDTVVRLDLRQSVQQRFADIAAEEGFVRSGQKQMGDRRRGAFAVASGHRVYGTRAGGEKTLHLRGQARSASDGVYKLRYVGTNARRAENVVLGDVLEIVFPRDERHTERAQRFGTFSQLLWRFTVPDGDSRASFGEKLRKRHIGNPGAEQGYGLILEIRQMRHDGILDSMVFFRSSIYRKGPFGNGCAGKVLQNACILPVLHCLCVIRFRGSVRLRGYGEIRASGRVREWAYVVHRVLFAIPLVAEIGNVIADVAV